MRRILPVCALAVGALCVAVPASAQTVLLSENFDSLELGQNYWEPGGSGPGLGLGTFPTAYTHTPPAGWTNDQSMVPTLNYPDAGVPEWEGWSFTNKDWWVNVAGDQGRGGFTSGIGTVAVIDGDEWDDRADSSGISPAEYGFLDGSLYTPAIDISSITAGTGQITFDSCWQDEGAQAAEVCVSFDGGATYQQIMDWTSDSASAQYHASNTNEAVVVPFTQPNGATEAIFKFRYYNAGNNWFWAVDNIAVGATGSSAVFTEDFESCVLGPPAWEPSGGAGGGTVVEEAYTHSPPTGWEIENDIPAGGVEEWIGWSFVTPEFWLMADGQNRSYFTLGTGIIAVADCDEWDDAAHEPGTYNTSLFTPEMNVAGYDSVEIAFDSSWRPEDDQKVRLVAEFDNGTSEELLLWNSYNDGNPNFHPDAENESLSFSVDVPNGATTLKYKFEMFDAGNDWWWAIDNVVVTATGSGSGSLDGDLNEDGYVNSADLDIVRGNWGQSVTAGCLACGDANNDGLVNSADLDVVRANWGASAAASTVPEPGTFVLLLAACGIFGIRRRVR